MPRWCELLFFDFVGIRCTFNVINVIYIVNILYVHRFVLSFYESISDCSCTIYRYGSNDFFFVEDIQASGCRFERFGKRQRRNDCFGQFCGYPSVLDFFAL